MASIMPPQRKQHVFVSKNGDKPLQHPLSPHTAEQEEDDQHMDDVDSDDNVLLYSHPLSPHATSRQDDQAQCINDNNVHTVSTANVTVTAHPLSPHTVEDGNRWSRSYSTSSATTPSLATNPILTPASSSTIHSTSTSTAVTAANARFVTANSTPITTSNNSATNSKTILLINGPNLNLLGHREPQIYGHTTLQDITSNLTKVANSQGINLQHFQSNHEADIIDRIHACLLGTIPTSISSTEYSNHQQNNFPQTRFQRPDAILINPGAFTHTSVALRDALLGISTPFVEIHISNVHAREEFRHKSFLSDKAEAVICGLGVYGYEAGVNFWARKWESQSAK